MTKDEKQNIKLEKVDNKTAYENLLIKYAELENQNKELKNNNKVYCEGNGETLVVNVSFDSFIRINANHKLYYPHNKELENQNKLLGERCNQLLKDKGYLTDQIADIKANCDLAIEGRDIKIKELEEQNEKLLGSCAGATMMYEDLCKATALLKKMFSLYFEPCVTHKDLENRDKLLEEVKQFIKE